MLLYHNTHKTFLRLKIPLNSTAGYVGKIRNFQTELDVECLETKAIIKHEQTAKEPNLQNIEEEKNIILRFAM